MKNIYILNIFRQFRTFILHISCYKMFYNNLIVLVYTLIILLLLTILEGKLLLFGFTLLYVVSINQTFSFELKHRNYIY